MKILKRLVGGASPSGARRDRGTDWSLPRVVLVVRETQARQLAKVYGTPGQAEFVLQRLGQSFDVFEQAEELFEDALGRVQGAIPSHQRRTLVDRESLPRFLFARNDLIVVVGQDGLVPNVAKYLDGQPVFGINPDPGRYDGVLCRHRPEDFPALLAWSDEARDGVPGRYSVEERPLARAVLDDGQELLALNEIYIGHRGHQSSRYLIRFGGAEEAHSSSGLICSTGTGATGWARSVARQRALEALLPEARDRRLVFFVREPFPSVATGCSIDHGVVDEGETLEIVSRFETGGVIFADGIESDQLDFPAGRVVRVSVASRSLRLVVPAGGASVPGA